MSLFSNRLLTLWQDLYRRAPRVTAVASLGFVVALFVVTSYVGERAKMRLIEEELRREQSLSYTQQLDALNSVQGSLTNLFTFVEVQKTKLKDAEDLIL